MSSQPDTREVIPAGVQERGYRHLFPIAQLLIERGHHPIMNPEKFGFRPGPSGMVCRLTRVFTTEDWDAINERYVVPESIVFYHGLIRDNANWVDLLGSDEITTVDGVLSAAEWEERERRAGRM